MLNVLGHPPRLTERTGSEEVLRQASRSDWPVIERFLVAAYGDLARFKAFNRWNWQFAANPFGDHGDMVPVWIALDDAQVVGQVAVQRGVLQVDGSIHRAGWLVDVMILPAHRGKGLGHRLHAMAVRNVPLLLTLTMAPATRRIAEKAGCITLGPVRQFTRWVRLSPSSVYRYLMARTEGHPKCRAVTRIGCMFFQFHRVFSAIANLWLRCRDLMAGDLQGPPELEMVEVDTFGEEVNRFWSETKSQYPVISPRDSAFLNWRFVDCPDLKYRRILAQRDGKTVGYAVLRRCEPNELPLGIIVDLFAARADVDTITALVRYSLTVFGDGVAAVQCATSVSEFAAVLASAKFFVTGTKQPTCVCEDVRLRNRLLQLKDCWFFSKADHDWDQIHLA